VAFMPRPIIVPLWTKTQPTGVSSVERASSAWLMNQFLECFRFMFEFVGSTIDRASRINPRWIVLSSSLIGDFCSSCEDRVSVLLSIL
jgi:hypothetical protein